MWTDMPIMISRDKSVYGHQGKGEPFIYVVLKDVQRYSTKLIFQGWTSSKNSTPLDHALLFNKSISLYFCIWFNVTDGLVLNRLILLYGAILTGLWRTEIHGCGLHLTILDLIKSSMNRYVD